MDTDLAVILVIVNLIAKFFCAQLAISLQHVQDAQVDTKSIMHTLHVILFAPIPIVLHVPHQPRVWNVI